MVGNCVRSSAVSAVPGYGASRPNFIKSLSFDPAHSMTRPGSVQSVISRRGAHNLGFPFRTTPSTSSGSPTIRWSSSRHGKTGPHGNARREVDQVLTGTCLCRKVRFEIRGELGSIVYCHCESCRKAQGTAFVANAPVADEAFAVTSGADLIAKYESSPGKYRCFCRNCGSPVYSYRASIPGTVRVRLGTLDGDPVLRPVLHSWVGEKAPWFEITDGLPQFRTGDPESLIAATNSEGATFEGSMDGLCLCGAVAFEFQGPATPIELCLCIRCRRAYGSAFAATFYVDATDFRWLQGQDMISVYDAPLREKPPAYRHSFCRSCGSPLPIVREETPTVEVPAGLVQGDF